MSNVGYATVSIIPSAKGFGAALNREIGPSVTGASRGFGDKAGKGFKGAFMAPLAGLGPAIAGVMGAAAVGDFLKDAVGQASDLNEVGTALKTVFGDGLGAVEAFGDTGAKALGMSKLEALQAAQTFGVYGKAAGLSGKENAKFSTTLASLGTDLASFYNTSPEQAIEAIGSGLRGEAEPLRQFGILLDDATLRQQALKMGLIKTTKSALTPQQKVLAAQAAIMNQSKVAQGDFAKTSGGLANQQRILAAQWTDAKGKIGGVFLPIILAAVKGVNGLFDAITPIKDAVAGMFSEASAGKGPLAGVVSAVQTVGPQILPTLKTVGATVGAVLLPALSRAGTLFTTVLLPMFMRVGTAVGGILLPALQRIGALFTGTVLPAVSAVVGYFVANVLPIFQRLYGIFVAQVLPIIGTFVSFITTSLLPTVMSIVTAIGTRLKPVFDAIYSAIQTQVLPVIQTIIAKFREWQPTIMKVVSAVVGVVGWVLKLAASILGVVLPPIIKFAGFLIGVVVKAVVAVIDVIVKIVGAIVDFGAKVIASKDRFGEFVSGVKAKIGQAFDYVKGIPGRIVKSLSKIGTSLLSSGGDLIRGFIEGIKKKAGDIVGVIKQTITDKLPAFVKKALGIKSPSRVFMALGGHVASGMAIGIERGGRRVTRAADALIPDPTLPGFNVGANGAAGAGSPLVGHLSIESRGNAKDDLEEALYQLRRLNRGGR